MTIKAHSKIQGFERYRDVTFTGDALANTKTVSLTQRSIAMSLNEIRIYFGIDNVATFRKEWNLLTPKDKEDIKSGLLSGSLSY